MPSDPMPPDLVAADRRPAQLVADRAPRRLAAPPPPPPGRPGVSRARPDHAVGAGSTIGPLARSSPAVRRRIATEVAVAAVLLLVIALLVRPAAPDQPSSGPARARSAWAHSALPRIGALLADIARVAPTGPDPADTARLRRDLDAARGLAAPPDRSWATAWSRALDDVDGATRLSSSSLPDAGPAAYSDLTAAGDALLYLSQSPLGPTVPITGR